MHTSNVAPLHHVMRPCNWDSMFRIKIDVDRHRFSTVFTQSYMIGSRTRLVICVEHTQSATPYLEKAHEPL